jgi:hypothetical protein
MSSEETLEGTVRVEQVGGRSKSAQRTVTLHTDDRVWLLRRLDGPRAGIDRDLAALAGRRVRVRGTAGTASFLARSVDIVDQGTTDAQSGAEQTN